jgi:hypothetical protein
MPAVAGGVLTRLGCGPAAGGPELETRAGNVIRGCADGWLCPIGRDVDRALASAGVNGRLSGPVVKGGVVVVKRNVGVVNWGVGDVTGGVGPVRREPGATCCPDRISSRNRSISASGASRGLAVPGPEAVSSGAVEAVRDEAAPGIRDGEAVNGAALPRGAVAGGWRVSGVEIDVDEPAGAAADRGPACPRALRSASAWRNLNCLATSATRSSSSAARAGSRALSSAAISESRCKPDPGPRAPAPTPVVPDEPPAGGMLEAVVADGVAAALTGV